MQFKLASIVALATALASAANVPRQFCSEAARFGVLTVSPTTVQPGDTITITNDFSCGLSKGYPPAFLDYSIQGGNNRVGPAVLARRAIPPGTSVDSFSVQVPHWFFTAGPASLIVQNTFTKDGTDGSDVLSVGSTNTVITITGV